MLSILNVQEESRNCEKLVTENDKLQEKNYNEYAKLT